MHRRHNASWGVLHYGAYASTLTACRFISKKEEDGFLFSSIASRIARTFEIKLLAGYDSSFEHVEKQFDVAYYPSVLALAKVQSIVSSSDRMAAAGFQAVLLLVSGARIATGAMTIGNLP